MSKNLQKMNCIHDSVFTIYSDTNYIAVEGWPSAAIQFNEGVYALFDYQGSDFSGIKTKLYFISNKGKINRVTETQEEIWGMPQKRFRLRNDSIILTVDDGNRSYFLDTKNDSFKSIPGIDSLLFEDNYYRITSRCNGEFGGTIFFKDKTTNRVYVGKSECALIVNKLRNKYFITNVMDHLIGFSSLYEVSNPSEMQPFEEYAVDSNKSRCGDSESFQGINVLIDTASLLMQTSFVVGNELYHFYTSMYISKVDKTQQIRTSIGNVKDNRIKSVHEFNPKIFPYLQQQITNNCQFLIFYTEKEDEFGFMKIDTNNIIINYFIRKNK